MPRHPKERPSSGISRRDFISRGAAVAAGIPMASALLAACSDNTTGGSGGGATVQLATPDNPVKWPITDSNQPIASDLPSEEGVTLKLYNWDQYIWKKVVDDFAKKNNCKVEISTFNNMDEAIAKIRSGQVNFDVFFPTIDVIGKLAISELLQPLNHDYLPNLKNMWPQFTDAGRPFYDEDLQYTVPYTVYRTGLAYQNGMVAKKDWPENLDNPYDVLWNPKLKGKISVYDDYREAIAASLLHNGVEDVNTGDAALLTAAKDGLLDMLEKTNAAFTINGTYEDLPKGIFAAATAWSGDVIAAPWYGKGSFDETAALLSYWWPEDHTGLIGNDNMSILKGAESPVLAHKFLDYIMDFDNSMKNMSWVGYQPPQIEAPPEAFSDPKFKWSWIVPNNLLNCVALPEDFDTGKQLLELPPDVDALWHDNWEQVTAGV